MEKKNAINNEMNKISMRNRKEIEMKNVKKIEVSSDLEMKAQKKF